MRRPGPHTHARHRVLSLRREAVRCLEPLDRRRHLGGLGLAPALARVRRVQLEHTRVQDVHHDQVARVRGLWRARERLLGGG